MPVHLGSGLPMPNRAPVGRCPPDGYGVMSIGPVEALWSASIPGSMKVVTSRVASASSHRSRWSDGEMA